MTLIFFLMITPILLSTIYPYTTLFRSSFTEQMKAIGQTPNTKLISYSIVNSTELLNDIFKNNETKFIKLVRLRSSDNIDRKSTRLNSSHVATSYAVFCL